MLISQAVAYFGFPFMHHCYSLNLSNQTTHSIIIVPCTIPLHLIIVSREVDGDQLVSQVWSWQEVHILLFWFKNSI